LDLSIGPILDKAKTIYIIICSTTLETVKFSLTQAEVIFFYGNQINALCR
jgi:hypothetical protein